MVLATRNPHKLAEFARLLGEERLEPLPPAVELGPETGATFAENALAKARAAASESATYAPVIDAQRVPPSACRTSQSR